MTKKYYDAKQVVEVVNLVLDRYGLNRLKHKATTWSGEMFSGCPRCALLCGDGGTKHFMVFPNRPVIGGADRREPVFYCRECTVLRGGELKPWTGDLIQFIRDTLEMSFSEAWEFLNIPAEYMTEEYKLIAPGRMESMVMPPPELWRQAAALFWKECQVRLWEAEGKEARRYLFKRRLGEEIIKYGRLGYTGHETLYIDGEAWGIEGKLKIPRGIVFPEFHIDIMTGEEQLWSISIRRPDIDLELEQLETGNKGAKYEALKGSSKGLYLFPSCHEQNDVKRAIVLVEGHCDALSIIQSTDHAFGATATQSAKGARRPYWKHRLMEIPRLVLVSFDNDIHGREAMEYWASELDEKALIWPVPDSVKDHNDMLKQGMDIKAWAVEGGKRFLNLALLRSRELAVGSKSEAIKEPDDIHIVLEGKQGKSEFLDPATSIVEPEVIVEFVQGCERCGAPAKYTDKLGNVWCKDDFAAMQLINLQEERGWMAFEFPGGNGLVRPELITKAYWQGPVISDELHEAFEMVNGGRVPPGEATLIEFCRGAGRAQIWLAAAEALALQLKLWKPKSYQAAQKRIRVIRKPCSNHQCKREAVEGTVLWPSTAQELHFCPRCFACHRLLLLAEAMGFPPCPAVSGARFEAGCKSWIAFVLGTVEWSREGDRHIFEVMYLLDNWIQHYKLKEVLGKDKMNEVLYAA